MSGGLPFIWCQWARQICTSHNGALIKYFVKFSLSSRDAVLSLLFPNNGSPERREYNECYLLYYAIHSFQRTACHACHQGHLSAVVSACISRSHLTKPVIVRVFCFLHNQHNHSLSSAAEVAFQLPNIGQRNPFSRAFVVYALVSCGLRRRGLMRRAQNARACLYGRVDLWSEGLWQIKS